MADILVTNAAKAVRWRDESFWWRAGGQGLPDFLRLCLQPKLVQNQGQKSRGVKSRLADAAEGAGGGSAREIGAGKAMG